MLMKTLALVAAVAAPVGAAVSTAPSAEDRFELMKRLAGTWVGPDEDGNGEPDYSIVYRPTAAGNTMHVTMFPGTDHEMMNLVHLDGEDVVLTHYCAGGNQPRMKAVKSSENSIKFDFVDGTNINLETDTYMGRAEINLADGRLTERWYAYQNGKLLDPVTFELTRVSGDGHDGAVHDHDHGHAHDHDEAHAHDGDHHTEQGMAPPTYYVVISRRGPQWREGVDVMEQPGIQDHIAYLESLTAQGTLLMAGPFSDYSGGMSILRADSFEDAKRIANGDSAVRNGLLIPEIREWYVPMSSMH